MCSWFLFELGLGQSEKYESVFDRVAFPVQARSMSYTPRSSLTLTFLETSTSYSRDMLSNIGGIIINFSCFFYSVNRFLLFVLDQDHLSIWTSTSNRFFALRTTYQLFLKPVAN